MSLLQAIVLAAIQGITELFPISSLGHAVILPKLLGWSIDQHGVDFLPFLVMLHVGTAVALLLYFWRDWIDILLAALGIGSPTDIADGRRLLMRLIVGTIPAVIIGFLLEKPLRGLFGDPALVAGALIVNGIVLFVAERIRSQAKAHQDLTTLSLTQALWIGVCQAGALVPGLSRSGLTIGAGLGAGLRHDQSARFSFLLAAPIIVGAAVLELPKLILHHTVSGIGLEVSLVGCVVAGLTAFASIAFLMRFFRRHEFEALDPFAYYCILFGSVCCAIFLIGGR